MDQQRETDVNREVKELLQEILKIQEMILARLERLEKSEKSAK